MRKNCEPKVKFGGDVPDIFPLTMGIGSTGLEMRYPDKFKADLPSMLKCIDPKYAASLPADLFPDPDGPLNIKEMRIAPSKYVKIVVVIQGPFEFFGGVISLPNLEVYYANYSRHSLRISKQDCANESTQLAPSFTNSRYAFRLNCGFLARFFNEFQLLSSGHPNGAQFFWHTLNIPLSYCAGHTLITTFRKLKCLSSLNIRNYLFVDNR